MTMINKKIGEHPMPQQDFRARIQPKSFELGKRDNDVLGPNAPDNILNPLWATRGVLFPYTPSIATGSVADYDPSAFVHTNYGYNAYIRSYPKPISLTAEFTAQSTDEAMYLLSVIHFFRSVTKMYFGINPYNKAGTPPPTLIFNYLGEYQFNNVPVVIKSFDYTYEATVDYVPVNTSGYTGSREVSLAAGSTDGWTYVPTHMTVSIEMDTQYIPINLRNKFNLDEFRQGKLVNQGFI
jgi:hypothetical protein